MRRGALGVWTLRCSATGAIDQWKSPPFEPVIRDGKIYGRGTSDNKGQPFRSFKGSGDLYESSGRPTHQDQVPLRGRGRDRKPQPSALCAKAYDLCRASAAIFSDSHYHESGRPSLILGLKGMLYMEIKVKELASDFHSMKAAALPSAPWRLVTLLPHSRARTGSSR